MAVVNEILQWIAIGLVALWLFGWYVTWKKINPMLLLWSDEVSGEDP